MKPCKNCPFLKGMSWYGAYGSNPNVASKIEALQETHRQGKFSCHRKHPNNHIFAVNDMIENDCAGFKMMLENIESKNKNTTIVNGFNETGPPYDLIAWFYLNSNDLNMLKLI